MKTISDRKKEGKEYRKTTSRSDLGIWEVETKRPLVKELILKQEETRIPQLIPERRKRMSVSPFTFFRGSAVIQAHDLAMTPRTHFRVQACGDAHMANFGIFASPERRMVFDINDFDETLRAPFEVDIKRLVASIEICGRDRGFSKSVRESTVHEAAELYRKTLHDCSEMGNMEVWYSHLDVEKMLDEKADFLTADKVKKIQSMLGKAMAKNSELAYEKLTVKVDDKICIKSAPPIIVPLREMLPNDDEFNVFRGNIHTAVDRYKESLPESRRHLMDQYEPIDIAHKVVGVGSVGRRAWIVVLLGREDGDPLVLQIKEAAKSVLEEYYGESPYKTSGQRVVEGQHSIQTAGDVLLGWSQMKRHDGSEVDYYVRQLWDSKGSFDLTKIVEDQYNALSLMCAWTLAHAHAKTGNRHCMAGYLGKSEKFAAAMTKYAYAYADQNEADYEEFMKLNL